jgi:hypothetical protein
MTVDTGKVSGLWYPWQFACAVVLPAAPSRFAKSTSDSAR